jgi:hypothetical protein
MVFLNNQAIAAGLGGNILANSNFSAATLTQLSLRSSLEYVMNGLNGKKISFWWKRHVAVSSFAIDQSFMTATNGGMAGRTLEFQFERAADLSRAVYGRTVVPGIGVEQKVDGVATGTILHTDLDDPTAAIYEPSWTQNLGFQIFELTRFTVGSQEVDTLVWWANQIGLDLRLPAGRRLYEMVGGWADEETRVRRSRQRQIFYTPFLFYWTYETVTPMRLISCAFHSVKITTTTRSAQAMICVPEPDLPFDPTPYTIKDVKVHYEYSSNLVTDPTMWDAGIWLSSETVKDADVDVTLLIEYVYLEQAERVSMANTPMCDLIDTHTACEITESQGGIADGRYGVNTEFSTDLHYNTPIKEFWVSVAREEDENACKRGSFPGLFDPVIGLDVDPINYMAIQLNSNTKIVADPIYFRLVQPYGYHTHLPVGYFYTYSFALDPESLKPTGSCPAGKLDSLTILLGLKGRLFSADSGNVLVRICGVGYNLVCYNGGLAAKAYV